MNNKRLNPTIDSYIKQRIKETQLIDETRKTLLQPLTLYIQKKAIEKKAIRLNFICTHNSRRSHMGQLWAQAASVYFGISNVQCYSGGTEATALNPRSVKALQKAGFEIRKAKTQENPLYEVVYSPEIKPTIAFSKKYSDKSNPQNNFAAIMTCSDADEACPVVFGADARFSVQYEDPKIADDTPEEERVYDERCKQIAVEMLYVFSEVKL